MEFEEDAFVLSARPARLKDILEIRFARPRDNRLKESEEFQGVVKCLREKLE